MAKLLSRLHIRVKTQLTAWAADPKYPSETDLKLKVDQIYVLTE